MESLTVRRLLVDLSAGFPRHWLAGDAFRSHYLNALSMSFPSGEQFFIDAVREAARRLPRTAEHEELHRTIAGFVGQEATHRQVHALYNAQLERQGLVNHWHARSERRRERARGLNPMHHLAVTCALEHCTAVFAHLLLSRPELLEGAHRPLATLWLWHSVEETEHKSVAFDLYVALGGNRRWRLRWYRYALTLFTLDAVRQTVNNLWHDGQLFKPRTWLQAASFLFGRRGFVWACIGPLASYVRRDFHPWRHDNRHLAVQWLAANPDATRPVGAAGNAP
jgi:predicted metal-dependent hydrolase